MDRAVVVMVVQLFQTFGFMAQTSQIQRLQSGCLPSEALQRQANEQQ